MGKRSTTGSIRIQSRGLRCSAAQFASDLWTSGGSGGAAGAAAADDASPATFTQNATDLARRVAWSRAHSHPSIAQCGCALGLDELVVTQVVVLAPLIRMRGATVQLNDEAPGVVADIAVATTAAFPVAPVTDTTW